MTARSEPLLWLQLLSIGVIPLELLLLRLVLAGSDPGPVPSLERVFIWMVAVLAPSIALWRRPADWGSLLFISLPGRGRTTTQRKLSGLQNDLFNRLGLVTGSVALLCGFWWLDLSSVIVHDFSPMQGSSRLIILLTCIPLLALLLWQWHQLIQCLWLISRSDRALSDASEFSEEDLREKRLSLGLGLLKLKQLEGFVPSSSQSPAVDDPLAQQSIKEPLAEVEEDKQEEKQQANQSFQAFDCDDAPVDQQQLEQNLSPSEESTSQPSLGNDAPSSTQNTPNDLSAKQISIEVSDLQDSTQKVNIDKGNDSSEEAITIELEQTIEQGQKLSLETQIQEKEAQTANSFPNEATDTLSEQQARQGEDPLAKNASADADEPLDSDNAPVDQQLETNDAASEASASQSFPETDAASSKRNPPSDLIAELISIEVSALQDTTEQGDIAQDSLDQSSESSEESITIEPAQIKEQSQSFSLESQIKEEEVQTDNSIPIPNEDKDTFSEQQDVHEEDPLATNGSAETYEPLTSDNAPVDQQREQNFAARDESSPQPFSETDAATLGQECRNELSEELIHIEVSDQQDTTDKVSIGHGSDSSALAIPIEPQQASEQDQSADLDAKIGEEDIIASGGTKTHREQSESCGSEESQPESPAKASPGGE